MKEFIEGSDPSQPILSQAIRFCKKNMTSLIVAKLDRISLDRETIFSIKKELGSFLKCCDMPTTDRLTLSIYLDILQCQKKIHSITLQTSFNKQK